MTLAVVKCVCLKTSTPFGVARNLLGKKKKKLFISSVFSQFAILRKQYCSVYYFVNLLLKEKKEQIYHVSEITIKEY